MNKFKEQIAIVTGGGKGIGQAIAKRFAGEGAKVAIWDADEIAGEETAREILAKGQKAHFCKCDITDEASVQGALSIISEKFGTPDILINNAGIANVGTATTTSVEDFDKVMAVNAKGMFLCLRNVLPQMVEKKFGVILNLASIASRLGIADRFAYSASKGAVLAMTLSVARDFVEQGIRCNCICPGRVHTPFVDGFQKSITQMVKKDPRNSRNSLNINPLDAWENLMKLLILLHSYVQMKHPSLRGELMILMVA